MKLLKIDFKDREGKWVLRFRYNGEFVQTRLGRLHNNMTQRANRNGSLQSVHTKSYNGVVVSEEFKDPQKFCDWAVNQIGWGLDYHLDKDLLKTDNRVYCPEYCVFIPEEINFNIRQKYSSNGLLLGVYKDKRYGKFYANLCIEGKDTHLGSFKTELEAHLVYKNAKETYVKNLAIKYKDTIDPRAYEALMRWEVQATNSQNTVKLAA